MIHTTLECEKCGKKIHQKVRYFKRITHKFEKDEWLEFDFVSDKQLMVRIELNDMVAYCKDCSEAMKRNEMSHEDEVDRLRTECEQLRQTGGGR